jgi:hypothetical protein
VFLICLFSVLLGWAGIKSPERTIELTNVKQELSPATFYDLTLSTLQYAMFDKDPFFTPITRMGHYINILIKIFIPIQATLLVFALRNRFRR